MGGVAVFALLAISIGVRGAQNEEFTAADTLNAFLTDCQLCRMGRDLHEKTSIYEEIESRLVSQCEKVPTSFAAMCEKVAARSGQRITEYLRVFVASQGDCSQLCAAPNHFATSENGCKLARGLYDNVQAHFALMLDDAAELCKREKNPFDCLDALRTKVPIGVRIAKNFLLRMIFQIDSAHLCGIDSAAHDGAAELISKEQNSDALPMKCSLCAEVCTFLIEGIHVHTFYEIVANAIMAVCKPLQPLLNKLPTPIQCEELPNLIATFLPMLCEYNPNNGGTTLCHMFYADCPDPNS